MSYYESAFWSDQRATSNSMSSQISQRHILSPNLILSRLHAIPFFFLLREGATLIDAELQYSRTDCTCAVRAHHSLFSLQTTPRHLGKRSVVSLQQQVGLVYLIRILHAPHCHICRNSHDAGTIAYRFKKGWHSIKLVELQ